MQKEFTQHVISIEPKVADFGEYFSRKVKHFQNKTVTKSKLLLFRGLKF